MEWINEDVALVSSTRHTAAILQLTDQVGRDHAYGSTYGLLGGNGLDHVPWGSADNQPNTMGVLVQKNNQIKPLLDSNRDMIYGTGVSFNRRVIREGKIQLEPYQDEQLIEWAHKTRLDSYLIGAINERVTNGNHFSRLELEMDGLPLLSVVDSYSARIAQSSTRLQAKYYYNPFFGDFAYFRPRDSEPVPGFDPRNPEASIVSFFHSREHQSGNPHYAFPSWWGASEWIELANLIPVFHRSGITNGYNIKYLVKMPKDYFDYEAGKPLDAPKVAAKWRNFGDNLSSWMAGTKNVNKTLLLKYMRDEQGKPNDAIDVVPLKNEMSDDAYSKVWEMANVSIANAAGILPTLAGVNPGKGNDSGSQIRVMAEFQQHFRTPVHHQILLEPVQQVLRLMGYKDIVPSFSGVQITTLDVNPTGTQAVTNHN